MTALCGGGASQVQPGKGEQVIISATLITGGLAVISPWLLPFAALLDAFVYDTLTACSTDPPAMPQWSLSDVASLLQGPFDSGFQASLDKLKDTVMNYQWYQFCQCSTGSPSPAFAPPAPPAGVTSPTNAGTSPCLTTSWDGNTHDKTGVGATFNTNIQTLCWPGTPTTSVIGSMQPGAILMNGPIPTFWKAEFTTHVNDAFAHDIRFIVAFYNSAGSQVANYINYTAFANGSGVVSTWQGPIPANAAYIYVDAYENDAPYHAVECTVNMHYYCGGASPLAPQAPCLTDPAAMELLQQIYKLLTLVQRQAVPFAYVQGASHTGLTGNGELAVSSILGYAVELTTVPGWIGTELGDPNVLWQAGWVNSGTADGWLTRKFVSANPYLVIPPDAGAITKIGYSFADGVVATIIELIREP